ncbi:MAG TPA: hypothetical protein EYP04_06640 [Anaerolineae bacterium]|nr:hypothetical protein [Anaerolineae bacterium]
MSKLVLTELKSTDLHAALEQLANPVRTAKRHFGQEIGRVETAIPRGAELGRSRRGFRVIANKLCNNTGEVIKVENLPVRVVRLE